MADANLTAPNLSAASEPISALTLRRLAAHLGELQPLRDDEDMADVHMERQEALFAAAAFLPIREGADAALAISGVAELIGGIMGHDVDEAARDRDLRRATMILARLAAWVIDRHGAEPLRTVWPRWADPFASDCA